MDKCNSEIPDMCIHQEIFCDADKAKLCTNKIPWHDNLKWTTDNPLIKGWYWFKIRKKSPKIYIGPIVVRVTSIDIEGDIYFDYGGSAIRKEEGNIFEWAGPIKEPK